MTEDSPLLKARKFTPLLVIAAGLLAYHNRVASAFVDDDFGSITEKAAKRRD